MSTPACPECFSQTRSIRLYTVRDLKPCRNQFHSEPVAVGSGRRATIRSGEARMGKPVTGARSA